MEKNINGIFLCIIFFILILIINNIYYQYFKDILNDGGNLCCVDLDFDNFPRFDPPEGSISYRWSQDSKLKSYVDSTCPSNGIFICKQGTNTLYNNTHIQFISEQGKIVYENTDQVNVSIWVTCLDGHWLVEGKSFFSITCSQK